MASGYIQPVQTPIGRMSWSPELIRKWSSGLYYLGSLSGYFTFPSVEVSRPAEKTDFWRSPESYPTTPVVSRKDATHLALISPKIDPEGVYMRLVPEQINCDLLKTWISHCKISTKRALERWNQSPFPAKELSIAGRIQLLSHLVAITSL
jgi:hypothetical protein